MRSCVVALWLIFLVPQVRAQASPLAGKVWGVTFDHWRGASGAALLRPSLRATGPRGTGWEVALTIFPDGIWIVPPFLVVGVQAGLAQRIPIGPVDLIAKAGGAAILQGGMPEEGKVLRAVPGVQAGLGLLVPVDRRSTLRLDVTRHVYSAMGYETGVWSFGVGVAGPWGKARKPR
jgi:hypothetical protein